MTTKTICAMFVTVALCGGCGGGASSSGSTTAGDETHATAGGETTGGGETADAGTGEATPPSGDGADWAAKIAAGQDRFDHVCGTCHPGGDADTGPDLHNKHWTAERVTNQIRNGGSHMRPIPLARLSDEDLPNVLAWLSTIGTVDGLQH